MQLRESCGRGTGPMRRQPVFRGLFVLAVALAGDLSVSAAQGAIGAKMYANALSSCQVNNASNFAYQWEGVYNTSAGPQYVDCGVPRHWPTIGGDMIDARITVTDKSSSDNVVCNMQGIDHQGRTRYTGAQQTTAGLAAGTTTFIWSPIDVRSLLAYFSCRVPAAGGAAPSSRSGINQVSVRTYL
jgi:hypothetical protein